MARWDWSVAHSSLARWMGAPLTPRASASSTAVAAASLCPLACFRWCVTVGISWFDVRPWSWGTRIDRWEYPAQLGKAQPAEALLRGRSAQLRQLAPQRQDRLLYASIFVLWHYMSKIAQRIFVRSSDHSAAICRYSASAGCAEE